LCKCGHCFAPEAVFASATQDTTTDISEYVVPWLLFTCYSKCSFSELCSAPALARNVLHIDSVLSSLRMSRYHLYEARLKIVILLSISKSSYFLETKDFKVLAKKVNNTCVYFPVVVEPDLPQNNCLLHLLCILIPGCKSRSNFGRLYTLVLSKGLD